MNPTPRTGQRTSTTLDNQRRFRSANQMLDQHLQRAQAEHGEEFDVVPLSLTLLLHRVTAMLTRATSIDLEPLQLSPTQFNVLAVLHRSDEPLTMRTLADALSVRPPNLTSVVDQMVTRKLIAKQVSPHDRRSYLVTTTTRGDRLMARFLPGHWQLMNEFYGALSATERIQLARLLDKLLASVQPESDTAQIAERIVQAALDAK